MSGRRDQWIIVDVIDPILDVVHDCDEIAGFDHPSGIRVIAKCALHQNLYGPL
jgi:hypothetical protein